MEGTKAVKIPVFGDNSVFSWEKPLSLLLLINVKASLLFHMNRSPCANQPSFFHQPTPCPVRAHRCSEQRGPKPQQEKSSSPLPTGGRAENERARAGGKGRAGPLEGTQENG